MSCIRLRQKSLQTPSKSTGDVSVLHNEEGLINTPVPGQSTGTMILQIPPVPKVPTSRWCGKKITCCNASTQYQEIAPTNLERDNGNDSTQHKQNRSIYFSPQPSQQVRDQRHSTIHSHRSIGCSPAEYAGTRSIRAKVDDFYFEDTCSHLNGSSALKIMNSSTITPSDNFSNNRITVQQPYADLSGDDAGFASPQTWKETSLISEMPVHSFEGSTIKRVASNTKCKFLPNDVLDFHEDKLTDKEQNVVSEIPSTKSMICSLPQETRAPSTVDFQKEPLQQYRHVSMSPPTDKRGFFLDSLIETPDASVMKKAPNNLPVVVLDSERSHVSPKVSRVSEQFSDYGASILRKFDASLLEGHFTKSEETLTGQSSRSLALHGEVPRKRLHNSFYGDNQPSKNKIDADMQYLSLGGDFPTKGGMSAMHIPSTNTVRDRPEMKGYENHSVIPKGDIYNHSVRTPEETDRGMSSNPVVRDNDRSISIVVSPSKASSSTVEVSLVRDWTGQHNIQRGTTAVPSYEIEISMSSPFISADTAAAQSLESPSYPFKR